MKRKISATIQARMGSSRLPGKVLREILGKPMLLYQIQRIKQSLLIDEVIIATSTSSADDVIEELAHENGIKVFRGSEDDVLGRVVEALRFFEVDVHVEFMGDNPIPDACLVDSIIGFYLKHADTYDYVTNALTTTYPPGFEVYVYSSAALFEAEKNTVDIALREHVGLHIYNHPEKFRIFNIEAHESIRKYRDYHFEVDTPKDFEVIKAVIEEFYPQNPCFTMMQAIDFLRNNPDLKKQNAGVHRRWKQFIKD
jgi:spore coat polysaccharide biosynthesis protein SpsF